MSNVCKFTGKPLDYQDKCSFCSTEYGYSNTPESYPPICFEANNDYNGYRGGNLRGKWGCQSSVVRHVNGPMKVDGDVLIEGDLITKGNIQSVEISDLNSKIYAEMNMLRQQIDVLKIEKQNLESRYYRIEPFINYLCEKLGINLDHIPELQSTLAERSDIEKRIDAIL